MEQKTLSAIERRISQNPPLFKLAGYNALDKVHKKQMEFHMCLKRNRWVFGGNRTGKTECGAVEAVWFARGIHPYRKINRPMPLRRPNNICRQGRHIFL